MVRLLQIRRSAVLLVLAVAPGAAAQQDSGCVRCHRNETPELVHRDLAGPHAGLDVGCVGCHGGNPDAHGKDEAHDVAKSYRGRISAAEVAALCGKCHEGPREALRRSPHEASLRFTGSPHCAHCHGSHGSAMPADLVATCAECHGEAGDPAVAVAQQMAALKRGAQEQYQHLTETLAAGNGRASATKKRLLEAELKRIEQLAVRAREVSHTLDLAALGASVRHLEETVRTTAAVAESDFAEPGGFSLQIVVLIFAAAAVGLLLTSLVLAVLAFRLARRIRRMRKGSQPLTAEAAT
jgi:hypothetical protein